MPDHYQRAERFWEGLPLPLQFTISGVTIGVAGNYATRAIDFVLMTLFDASVALQIQIALIFVGTFLMFDAVQDARLKTIEQNIINEIE